MIIREDGHRDWPSCAGSGERVPVGRVLTGSVPIEAEDGGAWVHLDHSGQLERGQLPAGLGDRAEPIGLAAADRGDGHGV